MSIADAGEPEIVAMKAPYIAAQTVAVFRGRVAGVVAGKGKTLTPAPDRTTYVPNLEVSWSDVDGQRWHRRLTAGQLQSAQRDCRQRAATDR